MKMKRVLSAVTAALVMALSIPVGGMKVGAAEFDYTDLTGTSITGVSFKKYLVMDENVSVPNTTFSFTAAPVTTAVQATSTTIGLKAASGTPTVSDVAYTTDDGDDDTITFTSVQTGDVSVTLASGQKYVRKIATVTFPDECVFSEPGVYRYTITETGGTATGITYDTATKYLDVYITDNGTGLTFGGYFLHNTAAIPALNATAGSSNTNSDKIDGIQNTYGTKTLRVGKAVSGNQASRDKYFKVTVNVSGINVGDKFTVSLAADNNDNTIDGNAQGTSGTTDATAAAYRNQTNVTEIIATGTSFSQDFYLQHGNYIAIQGLPQGATYTVSEDKEDYSSAKNATIGSISFNGGTASGESITDTLSDNTDVGFTNTRDGVIPTGILLSFTPLFVIGGIAVAGIIFLMIRRRRAE